MLAYRQSPVRGNASLSEDQFSKSTKSEGSELGRIPVAALKSDRRKPAPRDSRACEGNILELLRR
jgi:hypothetical protein